MHDLLEPGTKRALKLAMPVPENRPAVDRLRVASLRLEFLLLASLEHRGIVRAHDFGQVLNGGAFFTMDLLEGQTASALRRTGGLEESATLRRIILGLSDVLAYLHERGVLHCDLKPSNVLITKDRVVLLDLGHAALHREGLRSGMLGTPGFIAPEILDGRPPAPASDIFALGATIFALAEGRAPFGQGAVLDDRFLAPADWATSGLDAVSPELTALVATMLDPDPASRPTAHQLRFMLAQGVAERAELPLPSLGGRERLLAAARAIVLERSPRVRAIVFTGEEGSGKSRVLRALHQMLVLEGTRAILLPASARAPAISELVSRLFGLLGEGSQHTLDSQRHALDRGETSLEVLGPVLGRIAAEVAPVLLLDDAAALDDRSATALTRILEERMGPRWVFGGRLRGTETVSGDAMLELPIGALEPSEVDGLVRSVLGTAVEPEQLAEIMKKTGGMPGAVETLLRRSQVELTPWGWAIRSLC